MATNGKQTRDVVEEMRGPVSQWNPFPDLPFEEAIVAPYEPIPGAQYKVLVTKLGPSPRFGHYGEVLEAERFPSINFEELRRDGHVARVDVVVEAEPGDPNVIVQAQPHREVDSPPA